MARSRRFMQRIADILKVPRVSVDTEFIEDTLENERFAAKEDYPEPDRDWSEPYEP